MTRILFTVEELEALLNGNRTATEEIYGAFATGYVGCALSMFNRDVRGNGVLTIAECNFTYVDRADPNADTLCYDADLDMVAMVTVASLHLCETKGVRNVR